MKGADRRKTGRGGLELIEEAAHTFRAAPVGVLLTYYVGAIPFVLGFLYFWADMSRNPFATRHQVEAALVLAGLFIWMKHWQAIFSRQIRAQLSGNPPPQLTLRQHLRILLGQTVIQPTGLLVIPLSLIPLGLPLPWSIAFYQNAVALADPDASDVSSLVRKSWKQASLWPLQNHILLSLMAVFAGLVFVNCFIGALTLPGLIKMLFGIETVFSRSAITMLNTTSLTALCGLTFLCVDPILKVAYALRCFYGESVGSGEDIRAEIRRHTSMAPATLAAILVLAAVILNPNSTPAQEPAGSASAPPSSPTPASQQVSAGELDRQIGDVIQGRKYTWRMPRETVAPDESEPGLVTRFFQRIASMLRNMAKAVAEWIDRLLRWLFERDRAGTSREPGSSWMTIQQLLVFTLVAVLAIALALFLMRHWRRGSRETQAAPIATAQPPPDLLDENVAADQLPEDGWMQLGRELLEKGEYRLAMRAFYLSSLAHLAERNLISIAKFKSNRDYASELQRRAHALPGLLPLFGTNVSAFERIWYGMHEASRDLVSEFAANVERIRAA